MREAGLSLVRIAEFAWAKIEPEEGHYQWDWLDHAIDVLANEGLQIVLCTPTAAPPVWLIQANPDILPVDSQGQRKRFGSRRYYCSNNPIYRQYSARIVSDLAQRYGSHPAIIGWQIDNEFGCHGTARCYCPVCTLAFRRWLQDRYGSLQSLNQAWGSIFWSQVYSAWDQIDLPHLTVTTSNPSHILDFYRFSSDSVIEYQKIQVDLLRQDTHQQFVTHNLMGDFPDLDYHNLVRDLDFVSWDSYPTGYAEIHSNNLYDPSEPVPSFPYDLGDPYVTNFYHDLIRGLKRAPFWVMEQQCGHINWANYNPGIRPGAVRLWTWHALASGAEAIIYFRWRACLFAQEQYHSGLLHHDGSPAVGYKDIVSMAEELPTMDQVASAPNQAQVALLLDYNDLWAIHLQPHRKDFGYLRHLFIYYRSLAQLGIQTDIISPDAEIKDYNLVISPTAFISNEALSNKINEFVNSGGFALLGVRSGFKTISNIVTDQPLPGAYRQLIGATVTDWHALPPGAGYQIRSSIPGLDELAEFWAESLDLFESPTRESDSIGDLRNSNIPAQAIAHYASGPFTGKVALVEHPIGKGRAYYLGWYPTLKQSISLLTHLVDQLGLSRLNPLPSGVIHFQRGRFTLLFNFSDLIQQVDILGKKIEVHPSDVAITTT
jgi:beta-galactosidase